ncbi:hypothetical protein ES707_15172 [subsurface metagenome]
MSKSHGFTLIELSVVLLLLAIIIGITAPRLVSLISESTAAASARRLAGAVAYLRSLAARKGESFFLTIDTKENTWWPAVLKTAQEETEIYEEFEETPWLYEDGSLDSYFQTYREFSDDLIKKTKLEKGVSFEAVKLANDNEPIIQKATIEIKPDGTVTEAAIYLSGSKKRIYTVYIRPYTGHAYIYDEYFVPERSMGVSYEEEEEE